MGAVLSLLDCKKNDSGERAPRDSAVAPLTDAAPPPAKLTLLHQVPPFAPASHLDSAGLPGLTEAIAAWPADAPALPADLAERMVTECERLFSARSELAPAELRAFRSTGKSNRRPMQWARLAILPNKSFPFHAHPNIEARGRERTPRHPIYVHVAPVQAIYVAQGTLWERRFAHAPVSRGPYADGKAARVPDLSKFIGGDDFFTKSHPNPTILANEVGSTHRSYTEGDGADLFVLWGGCHADMTTEQIPTPEVLRWEKSK